MAASDGTAAHYLFEHAGLDSAGDSSVPPGNVPDLWLRSADFQSAVSQNCILRAADSSIALEHLDARPIANRRYGRLKICATTPGTLAPHISRWAQWPAAAVESSPGPQSL